jgi:hypothetical protein
MKTNATLGARKPKLQEIVCSVRKSWFAPVILAIMTIFSFSNFATAQTATFDDVIQSSNAQVEPVIIVIKGEYPGPDAVPSEIAQYAFAKVDGPEPTIENCPADQTVECFSNVGHSVAELDYTIYCGPAAIILIYEPAGVTETGSCPGTEYTVTYVVYDQCGNSTACEQTFTLDNEGPQITFCPAGGEVASEEEAVSDLGAVTWEVSCPDDELCATVDVSVELTTMYDPCLGDCWIYTYTITDGCGRTDECEQMFNIPPAPLEIACNDEGEEVECFSDIMPTEGDVTVTGAIDDESVTTTVTISEPVLVSGQDGCDGAVYEVTYTASDDCENRPDVSCTRTYTLSNDGPTIEAPADLVLECAEDAAVNLEGVSYTTSCELGAEVTSGGLVLIDGNGTCDGSVWNIVYTVTDDCGRAASATQVINIENEGPSIEAPADVTLECAEDAAVNIDGAVASAACSLDYEVTASDLILISGNGTCDGSVWNVIYTVTDECERTASATQTITIENAGPSIEAPADVTIECAEDAAADIAGAVASAACNLDYEVTASELMLIEGNGVCDGSVWKITYTVTDECERTASDDQYITIENEGPSITAPADETVECASDVAANLDGVTASAACSLTYEVTAGEPVLVEGESSCPGATYSITYTIVDQCDRSASATQTFTIENDGPSITAPADMMAECAADVAANLDGAVASAACDLGYEVTAGQPVLVEGEGSCPGATYSITYTVMDDCGRTATDEQLFTIDNDGPTIEAPADLVLECAEDAAVNLEGVSYTTSCDLGAEVTSGGLVLIEGNGTCDGSVWNIVYTVTDDCGRTASATQVINIENEGPSIEAPADVTLECAEDAAVNIDGAVASAACSLDYEVTASELILISGNGTCDGSVWNVIYTVTDECERTASATQTITIENAGPSIEAPADATVACIDEVVAGEASASAACSLAYEVTYGEPVLVEGEGSCDGAVYTITYTVTDECERTAEATQTFTIENDGLVLISGPADTEVSCYEDIAPMPWELEYTVACSTDVFIQMTPPNELCCDANCPGAQYEMLYTLMDACGNSVQHVQIFTIANADPVIITCGESGDVDSADDIEVSVEDVVYETSCGLEAEVSVSEAEVVDNGCEGTDYIYTYSVTDECGRTVTCTRTFTVPSNDPDCNVVEGCYPDEVLAFEQGLQTNGNPVALDRSNPDAALGMPDASNAPGGFVSLGVNGYITLGFPGIVNDGPGNDILIYETSFSGDVCGLGDDETADIEVTQDGTTFVSLGSICRDGGVDIAGSGLDYVIAIRITNNAGTATLDGYDVDGVVAIYGCGSIPEIVTGECYAAEFFDYNPGVNSNGGAIEANRTDGNQALGMPEGTDAMVFATVGYGGEITFGFNGAVLNQDGPDVEVIETSFGNEGCAAYPEYVDVYVSQDGDAWYYTNTICKSDNLVEIDDAGQGFTYITYVKLVSNDEQTTTPDGFDVDGIIAIHNCLDDDGEGEGDGEGDDEGDDNEDTGAALVDNEVMLTSQPNPTADLSTVFFTTTSTSYTTLEVFDMSGRQVTTLFNQVAQEGQEYRVNFDGAFLPNGVYIYRLTTENEVVVDKFMIAR